MFFRKALIENEKYSAFSKFLLREIPKVKNNQKIWHVLLFATGIPRNTSGKDALIRYRKDGLLGNKMNDIQARLVITIGMPPEIVPLYLPLEEYGMFHTSTPAILYINENWIERFAKDS